MDEKDQKKIEVIPGDGNLNISPVYEHLEVQKPKKKDSRAVVVPEVKDTVCHKKNKDSHNDKKLEEN